MKASSFIDELLAEQQQLTAVERFAQRHVANRESEDPIYRELIPLERPRPGEQYAFQVDLDLCTGCKACVSACHSLNGLDEDETWRAVGLLHGGSPETPVIRAAQHNLRYHLAYIGWLVRTRDWLGGDRMSYADLAAATHLSALDYLGDVPWNEDEMAKTWYARVKSRPSFRPLLAETLAGIPPSPTYADLDF